MRVLVVTQYFWPENFKINDLVSELNRRNHQLTILTGKPNYPSGKVFEEYKVNPKRFTDYDGVNVLRVPMLSRGQGVVRLFLNYLSFVVGASVYGPWRLRDQKFDVIFVFEPSPITVGLPAILIGRLKRVPVVFWALDLWPETLSAIGVIRSKRMLSFIGRLVSYIYNRCTLVLGQSRMFLTSIGKYCSDKKKIHYFPSWSEDIFGNTNVVKAPEISENSDTFDVLFAGNIGEAQDLPAVLTAAEKLRDNKNIRWLVVGDGRKFGWLQDEVKRRGLANSVLLLGRFAVDRMPSFYAHADALLVSLKRDPVFSMTIPGKVQTYLMSGIPIVGMLDGEGAEVIRRANAGYVCGANDSDGLVKIVSNMAAISLEQRRELGLNGRRYAESEFDRGILIGRLESFFDKAVKLYKEQRGS